MSETDKQFVERIGNTPLREIGVRDGARLLSLARKTSDFDIQAITKSMSDQARILCEQLAEISRLRTALATARNDALDEAAKVALKTAPQSTDFVRVWSEYEYGVSEGQQAINDAILALITKPTGTSA